MTHDRDLADRLRDAMTAETRAVTASSRFTDRVIGAAAGQQLRDESQPTPRAWHGWLMPAVAAAVVAVLLAAVLVGGSLLRSHRQPPTSQLTAQPAPSSSGTPTPSATGTPSRPAASSARPSRPAAVVPPGGPVPAGFRALDLTWVSTEEGWALGSAPCAKAPCTSIVRTTDGGRSWVGLPAPAVELAQAAGCTGACVSHLRFANPMVGYAFGSTALFMTTDGGNSWIRQPGQADSLEIADGSVLRVVSQGSCMPGCSYRLQRSAIGGLQWQDVALPAGGKGIGGELVRNGHTAVISTFGNPAGGAQDAGAVLFISGDDGASWTNRGEPCPRVSGGVAGGETDTHAATIAADGSITVLCTPRGPGGAQFTMTSTDGGRHFTAAPASLGATGASVIGTATAGVQFVQLDRLYRSTDGGRNWQRISGGPQQASYIGFESATVGRVLDPGGSQGPLAATVWTTRDAGNSWTSHTFG